MAAIAKTFSTTIKWRPFEPNGVWAILTGDEHPLFSWVVGQLAIRKH
jgi:hypothetical protein